MRTVTLPSLVFIALYTTLSAANPLPSNAINAIPNNFVMAPLYTPPAVGPVDGLTTDSHIVSDSYLIVLQDHLVSDEIAEHHDMVDSLHEADLRVRSLRGDFQADLHGIKHKWSIGGKQAGRKAMKGYSGKFSESTLDAIRSMKGVKYVERDSIVKTFEKEIGAPWGLARISHRKSLSFGTFNRYDFDSIAGEGVDAYVIDTGVNIHHVELEGRAKWGKTIPKDPDQDLNGHGSHVAGTIASAKYGVAKKANIIAVKVLGAGGSGTMSDVIQGVSWAADQAYEQAQLKLKGKNPKHKGSVANMSLGGGKSQGLDDAVDAAVEDGLHFAVAAGNDNRDACSYSPAGAVNAITVGASTIQDERAYFSNHGKCVDVIAPGLNILSIWNTGNRSINTISGTSMASPHVAGLAAYFLSIYPENFNVQTQEFDETAFENFYRTRSGAQQVLGRLQEWIGYNNNKGIKSGGSEKPLSPKALKNALEKVATKGALTDLPAGTPNLLIFNNYTASA